MCRLLLLNVTMIPTISCPIHRRLCRVPRSGIFLILLRWISAKALVRFSLSEEGSFSSQLRGATVDMAPDEGGRARAQKASQLQWDRKRKRFSRAPLNSGNEKMIRSESGALLPATFNSGRFETWKKRAKGSRDDPQDSLVCHSSCHI
jgi:hypothetical protein